MLQIVTIYDHFLAPTRLRVYHWHIGREPHRHRHITHNTHTVDNTYNDWRNHATWAIGLHLMDTVIEMIMDDKDNYDMEEADAAGQLFEDLLEEQIAMSELDKFPLLMDLFNATNVDWHSLGQYALDSALA